MFASSYPPGPNARALRSGLYQQVGVETQVSSANPHQLVAMLFDGFMEALAQARGAMRGGQREAKGLALGRAVRIVEEGLLDALDLASGGELAANLSLLYGYVSRRLTLANLRNDEAMLQECADLVQPLRDAWSQIAAQAAAPAPKRVVNG